ncbi:MAG TPA: AAA family ATPase, partial [Methanocorpusculum sp.]|nr:AAA family ATPase [Methanocorpusculum sp.]
MTINEQRADALEETESLAAQLNSAFNGPQDATVIHTQDRAYVLEQIDAYAEKHKENLIIWKDRHDRHGFVRKSRRSSMGGIYQVRSFQEDVKERTEFNFAIADLAEISAFHGCQDALGWYQETRIDSFVFCVDAETLEDVNSGLLMLYYKCDGMKKASHLILVIEDDGEQELSGVLDGRVTHINVQTPGVADIRQICITEFEKAGKETVPDELMEALPCLKGMDSAALRKELKKQLEATAYDVSELRTRFMQQKFAALGSGALEYEEIREQPSCGGLDILKEWIDGRSALFSEKAKAFGLEAPKGVLLLGPPGTGKSLAARNMAWVMHLPLLNFRISGLLSCFLGGTEKNADRMFRVLDDIGPCVLFIDEIEKLFAGAGSGGNAHETSKHFLSQLLTWMNDRKSEVFVVGASNWLTEVPVEMTRAGRFDAIFYVGLPGEKAREEIFTIHLEKRHQKMPENMEEVVKKSAGYSGAEIGEVVKNAALAAFRRDADCVTEDDLLTALPQVQPLASTRADDIYNMAKIGHQLG